MPEPDIYRQQYAEASPRSPQPPSMGYWDTADLNAFLDKPMDGWSGPSLDQFTGVSYAGDPGYGIMNDNIDHPATVGLGGFTIPSQEVGVGRRLDRYAWTVTELGDAIGGLIENGAMRRRLREYSNSVAPQPSSRLAATEIFKLV